ncbi:DUF4238 domain-containing protein [Aquidulcibacter paucihalophilus]|uniref:DUF4238 domain-containing protein n=1 Tax=Aquidulcibacter paucihalophilus TaxID=1978549 RepID=UPI000A19779C|nr:DUF4238 domain-containing protein [Aquidulcibacter paucihalophilus]
MNQKPLKTELHHWWPRTLADHWAAADGMVSVIRPNGVVRRAPPGAYGAITNAHHIKVGGPWNSTFEPIFNEPDSEMAAFVQWLGTIEASLASADQPLVERILPQVLPEEQEAQIARVTASLLARSPYIRESIRQKTERYRGGSGLAANTDDKTLIAANQRGLYDAYRMRMMRGRWAILFSEVKEFITGDGFLNNFPASRDVLNSGLKLVLPILPTATIVYMSPMQYPTEPSLVTLRLDAKEVARLNEITQVYARDFLFFRDEEPKLSEAFICGEHCQFQYHRHHWLDPLLDDLSQYYRWGKDGTAGILSRRLYSKYLEGNGWLDSFVDRDV